MFLSALWCWRLLAVERGAAREHMRREAWRGNVPPHCSFHGWRVRLLGHSHPITWETSFTLQSGGVFPLNTTVLFHRVSRSHLLCSSSLYLSFSSYQRLSVMRASAGQEVMRWIKLKERVGNGHKDSWEELWRIRTLFWCLGVYEETGWIDGRRSEGELTDGAGLIGGSLNEP